MERPGQSQNAFSQQRIFCTLQLLSAYVTVEEWKVSRSMCCLQCGMVDAAQAHMNLAILHMCLCTEVTPENIIESCNAPLEVEFFVGTCLHGGTVFNPCFAALTNLTHIRANVTCSALHTFPSLPNLKEAILDLSNTDLDPSILAMDMPNLSGLTILDFGRCAVQVRPCCLLLLSVCFLVGMLLLKQCLPAAINMLQLR